MVQDCSDQVDVACSLIEIALRLPVKVLEMPGSGSSTDCTSGNAGLRVGTEDDWSSDADGGAYGLETCLEVLTSLSEVDKLLQGDGGLGLQV